MYDELLEVINNNYFPVWEEGKLYSKRLLRPIDSKGNKGYLQLQVVVNGERKTFRLHRIMFLLYHGYLPDIIDHWDGDIYNNRPSNLRPATVEENRNNQFRSMHPSIESRRHKLYRQKRNKR